MTPARVDIMKHHGHTVLVEKKMLEREVAL